MVLELINDFPTPPWFLLLMFELDIRIQIPGKTWHLYNSPGFVKLSPWKNMVVFLTMMPDAPNNSDVLKPHC